MCLYFSFSLPCKYSVATKYTIILNNKFLHMLYNKLRPLNLKVLFYSQLSDCSYA